jgi:ribosomal protein S18 acetylase RimI-like enzyme
LVADAEARIRRRGCGYAGLGVEHDNPRARALYERLGYVAYGDAPEEWDAEDATGALVRYRTMCTLVRKPLG